MPRHATLDGTGKVLTDQLPNGGVGPTGPQGPPGAQGTQGIQGIQGPAGSGSAPIALTVNVPSATTYYETTAVATGATVNSKARARLALRTDAENDIEHAQDIRLTVAAQTETNIVRFIFMADSAFTGPLPIIYEVFV